MADVMPFGCNWNKLAESATQTKRDIGQSKSELDSMGFKLPVEKSSNDPACQ